MKFFDSVLERSRIVMTFVGFLSVMGLVAFLFMPREEDPRLADRFGLLTVVYPGADAETVERLVSKPLERQLSQVSGIKYIETTSRQDAAIARIELEDRVTDVQAVWDEVDDAIEDAQDEFPRGVGKVELDHSLISEQEAIVLSVTGSHDRVVLRDAAERAQERLLGVRGVSEVRLLADPQEQIVVEYEDRDAKALGLSPRALVAQLSSRNGAVPTGGIELDGKNALLSANDEFESVRDLEQTPIVLASGKAIPLAEVARVRRAPAEPTRVLMRVNGRQAVGLGVVPDAGLDVVELGARLRDSIATLNEELGPLTLQELSFQPDYVEERLSSLGGSLLLSVGIVAIILVIFMGLRLGLVVASIIPLVALGSLALFAWGGGVLHQLSIAAFILSLGLLVDNAIVMVESAQRHMDEGRTGREAALLAARELAWPLFSATGTTIASFVPMFASTGPTADFTRAIPVVAMLTLGTSYVYAVFVTPNLSARLLRPRRAQGTRSGGGAWFSWVTRAGVQSPKWTLALAFAAVLTSGLFASRVSQSFFPQANRNQLIVEVFLPEGAHFDRTDRTTRSLERFLEGRPEVNTVASFIGQSAPSFYYNLPRRPLSPHFAHLLVTTHERQQVSALKDAVAAYSRSNLPEAEVVPRFLEQGPPLTAPIEVRLYGDDLSDLYQRAGATMAELRNIAGVANVQQSLGPGQPRVHYEVDDVVAAESGVNRADLAQALWKQTRGLSSGQVRYERESIPLLVRSAAGDHLNPQLLDTLDVTGTRDPVVFNHVASSELAWTPASILRRDQRRFVTVSAHLGSGVVYSDVVAALEPRLNATLGAGSFEFGGAVEGAGNANASLVKSAPLGALLLILFILAEFNSFRRLAIVLVTAPLAVAGIVPGLLLFDQAFGFMSLLGIFSLIGIVVNNAIVLLSVIDARRSEGVATQDAIIEAVRVRTRPILLTTATTVAGLLPLAFSDSPLWPPMASAMITGLIASTGLTLFVVPALYRLLFPERPATPSAVKSWSLNAWKRWAGAATLLTLSFVPARAEAEELTLPQVIERAAQAPGSDAAQYRAEAAQHQANTATREAFLPTLTAQGTISWRDRELDLETPAGDFPFGDRRTVLAVVSLEQPLLNAAHQVNTRRAARQDAQASRLAAQRTREGNQAQAVELFFDAVNLQARLKAVQSLIESLQERVSEVQALESVGRAVEADELRIELELDDARQGRLILQRRLRVAERALGRSVGQQVPVSPRFDPAWLTKNTAADQLGPGATARRADLLALDARERALRARKAGLMVELVPRVDLVGRLTYNEGSPYAQNTWAEGLLVATWTPFAKGTRFSRRRSLEMERRVVQEERRDRELQTFVQVERAQADLAVYREELAIAERGVRAAEESLRVSRERFSAGRETINDVLEAEAQLFDRAARKGVARGEIGRAQMRLLFALGRPLEELGGRK